MAARGLAQLRPVSTVITRASSVCFTSRALKNGKIPTKRPTFPCSNSRRTVGLRVLHGAAEEGYAPAQVACGQMAEAGGEDKGDMPGARAWYEKAAAQGNPDGLLALSRFFDNGLGGPKDHVKALEACRGAAAAGSLIALNEIGVRYQKGQGLPIDPTAAIGYFTMASQGGLPAAHVNLGNCYEIGKGVFQDPGQAFAHYSAAAKQGFGPAQYLLGALFETGRGTAADLLKAYINYSLGAANGVDAAKKKAEEIKAKLTPEQLAEAAKVIAGGGNVPAAEAPKAKPATPAPKPKK